MSKVRILFLGTPDIAAYCLEQMLQDEHYDIVGVVTQPDRPAGRKLQLQPSPVKKLALERGLKVLTPNSVNTPEVLDEIAALTAESAVVVAFGQILSQKFLDLFPRKAVNVHASLLPRWRGAAPIQRAIMAGDVETGVSLQVIVRKLDAGDVLGARKFLLDDLDAVQVYGKMQTLAGELLHIEYMDYLRGNLTGQPQDEALVTVAPKIEKSEAEIQWARSAHEIQNQIRGLAMGPQAWTRRQSALLKIHRTHVFDTAHKAAPGTVIQVGKDSFVVACGRGQLEVFEVQPESRARMSVPDYLRGHPLQIGDKLG